MAKNDVEETTTETLTLAEAADYLNRSIGWFNAERKEILISKGATLGGRGVGSSIPVSVLEELAADGWQAAQKTTRTRSEYTGSSVDVSHAEKELSDAEEALAAAKAHVADRKKNLTAVRRAAEKAEKASSSAAVKKAEELEKEAAKAAKVAERLARRAAEAKAKAGIE